MRDDSDPPLPDETVDIEGMQDEAWAAYLEAMASMSEEV